MEDFTWMPRLFHLFLTLTQSHPLTFFFFTPPSSSFLLFHFQFSINHTHFPFFFLNLPKFCSFHFSIQPRRRWVQNLRLRLRHFRLLPLQLRLLLLLLALDSTLLIRSLWVIILNAKSVANLSVLMLFLRLIFISLSLGTYQVFFSFLFFWTIRKWF